MPIFSPPPLPQQRLPPPPPSVQAVVTSGAGSAAGTSTAQAIAPFGAGASTGTATATAVGAALASGTGSSSGTSAVAATTNNIFPLIISSDGRYLKQSNGTPFLICADTTWSLAVNIPLTGAANINTFLADITGKGFNSVMMNVIEHHYTVVKPPQNLAGRLPFTKRLDGATYTGSPNGTTGAAGTQGQFSSDAYSSISTQAPDPTFINNAYWQDVETILNACVTNNVAVFVWVCYFGFHNNDEGWLSEMVEWNAVTGAGGFTGFGFANPAKSKMWNYGAWLADRWKTYPNLVWVLGGDYGSNSQTLNSGQKAAVEQLADGMRSVAGQQSTLFTAHWDRPAISTDTALATVTFDLNLAYCDESVAELCRRGYAVTPAEPTFLGEYNYEAGLFGGSVPFRKYMYWGFLGGISGGFFGHEQLWRFDDGTPGTDWTTLLSTQGTIDASRQFALWKSKPWHRLIPNGLNGIGTLITAGGGTASPQSTSYVAAAATPEGDLLLAYVPPAHTGSVTVDMTKLSATAQARWFDPSNATFTNIGSFNNTGTQAFTTPGSNSAGDADFLLVIETAVGASTGTSTATAVGASIAATTGSAAGSSSVAAQGQSTAATTGISSGTGTAAAVSGTIIAGAGTVAGSGTAAAVGASLASGTGSSAAVATATAVGQATASGSGAAAGTTVVAAVGQSTAPSSGAAAGTASVTALGTALVDGLGSATGSGTAAGVGAAATSGNGTSSGTATATAVGASVASGTGTTTGSGTATAIGASIASGTGASTGSSTAVANGNALVAGTGASAGTSTATAPGQSLTAGSGTGVSSGFSTTDAVGSAHATGVGAVVGTSTVNSAGASSAVFAGSSFGNSTVSGAGTSVARTSGISAGIGTALGVGEGSISGASVGVSAGTSTAIGSGASLVSATGIAAGIGTAIGSSALNKPAFQVPVIRGVRPVSVRPIVKLRRRS